MDFEKKLTKAKEEMFKDYVQDASKILNLSFTPKVKIWGRVCPHSGPNEIAHAHPDRGLICISRSVLKSMTLEEIKETAIHEVVHMVYLRHDTKFHTEVDETHLISWLIEQMRPKIEELKIESTEIDKVDKEKCNYHLCRKKTKLDKCKLCGNYFCKKHKKPRVPGIPRPTSSKKEDKLFMEEYHKMGGHPCFSYVEHWKVGLERKEKEYAEALDRLLKFRPLRHEPQIPEPVIRMSSSEPKPKISDYLGWIVLIIIIIFLIYLFIFKGVLFQILENIF